MADPPSHDPYEHVLLDAIGCPHCGQVTMPNLLEDGSLICSCSAQRTLPLVDGVPFGLAPPVDDYTFGSAPVEHPVPPGWRMATEEDRCAKVRGLPGQSGLFGMDAATELYLGMDALARDQK
jgi:hypothetical protein